MQFRLPDRPRAGSVPTPRSHAPGRPTCRQRYRRQQQTTASKTILTGPLGGPVLTLCKIHQRTHTTNKQVNPKVSSKSILMILSCIFRIRSEASFTHWLNDVPGGQYMTNRCQLMNWGHCSRWLKVHWEPRPLHTARSPYNMTQHHTTPPLTTQPSLTHQRDNNLLGIGHSIFSWFSVVAITWP